MTSELHFPSSYPQYQVQQTYEHFNAISASSTAMSLVCLLYSDRLEDQFIQQS